MDQKKYIKVVLSNFMFKELDSDGFRILFKNASIKTHKLDDVIIQEGTSGSHFCMLVEGSVVVTTIKDGITTELARLKKGAVIGEVAALTGATRTATITAAEDSKTIFFHKNSLIELTKRYKSLKDRFEDIIVSRAIDTINKLND